MSLVRTAPATFVADEPVRRNEHLEELLRLLYPAPCEAGGSTGTTIAEYLVVPDVRQPRLLVPASPRRVAAAAVHRHAVPRSRLAAFKRGAMVAALRTGVSTMLLRDRVRITSRSATTDTVEAYLRTALDTELLVSVRVGAMPVRRRPVLQLLSPAGTTIGFAKIGAGPHDACLVRAETAALTALAHAGLRHLSVPRVLHAGRWQNHQVLVQEALPTWRPAAPLDERWLSGAMREVAGCCGVTSGPLAGSRYWMGLRERLATVAGRADGDQLHKVSRAVLERVGGVVLRYGAWHGDWTPGNMAMLADRLLVWDWARFATGVPIGFDALHHRLYRRMAARRTATVAAEETVRDCAALLAPFEVDPHLAAVTATLYLLEVAVRDLEQEPGSRANGTLANRLLPVLQAQVEALCTSAQ